MRKHIITIFALTSAFLAVAELRQQFMFSADGVTSGSSLRDLPSQGVNLKTRQVVIGLHALPNSERVKCGWYQLDYQQKPDTNHYWKATNYVFQADGTVRNNWTEYTPKARPERYSKLSIIERLEQMNGSEEGRNKWTEVKAKIEDLGLMDKWNACTYIQGDDPNFVAAKPMIAAFLGMTEKQLDDWLSNCRY